MNYIPFDPALIGQQEIIIWCPEEENYDSLMDILTENHVLWMGGNLPREGGSWSYYRRLSGLRVSKQRMMARADISYYEKVPKYSKSLFTIWDGDVHRILPEVEDLI